MIESEFEYYSENKVENKNNKVKIWNIENLLI
jgi:hypothetical protein